MIIGFLLGNLQGNGGIARVVSIIANELCKQNEIHIISFCPSNENAGYKYDDTIKCTRIFDESRTMTKAILMDHAIKKIKMYVVNNNIDLLIACGELYFLLGILSVRRIKTKCYCWEHSDPAGTSDHKFQMFARKYAVKKADKIIVLTKAAKKYYEDVLNLNTNRIVQIYNPVERDVMQASNYNENSKKILSVGRLTFQKNFQLLIKVAKRVLNEYDEWTWDICGEGEDRQELENMIKTYGLVGRVNLRGQVKDLYFEYKNYSFQVMTSRYEGFPMSLIEGEANGLPLITFDVPTGPSEIIKDGVNGYLINYGNIDAMVSSIRSLMDDCNKRKKMSANAYKMSEEFELCRIIKQWRELCQI